MLSVTSGMGFSEPIMNLLSSWDSLLIDISEIIKVSDFFHLPDWSIIRLVG